MWIQFCHWTLWFPLTLQRRQECCPSLLQETPEVKHARVTQLHTKFQSLNDTVKKEVRLTHIWMFLPEGLGSSPGAQTDHPHIRSSGKRSSERSVRLFGKWEQSVDINKKVIWTGALLMERVSYHDPTHSDRTQCSQHQSADTHRHGCSDTSCCGTPRLHRSHILPPYGEKKDEIKDEG